MRSSRSGPTLFAAEALLFEVGGVLVEVPVVLSLVWLVNGWRGRVDARAVSPT